MMGPALRRLTAGVCVGLAVLFVSNAAIASLMPRLKPPAPGPEYVSPADFVTLKSVHGDLKAKRFSAAKSGITNISDPIAGSLGRWMYFISEDPTVSIKEADAFLDAHPNWPAIGRIQRYVEKRIPNNAPASEVLAFFGSRDPVSGDGKIQLARALFSTGDETAAEIHLRDAWINNNFSIAEERRILKVYSSRLSKDDHAARVDRLLWSRQVTNARRVIPKLTGAERRKAEARAAFILGAGSAPKLYRSLSRDHQLDSGVLLAAVRYHRRTNSEQFALSLANDAPDNPVALRNPGRWWYERQLLMRWALKQGRFADAYSVVANHGMDEGSELAVAEFNAGWIALRFLNEPERAETHFQALAASVGTPISLSRAYYWLGRSAEAQGKDASATEYYATAAQYHYSYYGQLAAEELGGPAREKGFAQNVLSSPEDRALFSSRPTVAALRILSDLDLDYEFMVFAYHIDDQLDRPGEYVELAKLTNGEGAPHLTVRAGKVSVQRNAFTPQVSYPIVFVPEEAKRFVQPEVILGLSRQESEFNPRAFSRAGARGMMQLLPSTAQITAKKEGMRYSRSALLDDPVYNMTVGSAHLSHLLQRFNGSLIMTFAGYNAGPHRVDRWVREYGDPRTPNVDPIDWVELIPFEETRNYVQRVLENTQVYRGRLNDAAIPGRLSIDLERGGSGNRAARVTRPSAHLARLAASHGAQRLSPLPAATQERARKFMLARQATLIPDASVAQNPQGDDGRDEPATQNAPETAFSGASPVTPANIDAARSNEPSINETTPTPGQTAPIRNSQASPVREVFKSEPTEIAAPVATAAQESKNQPTPVIVAPAILSTADQVAEALADGAIADLPAEIEIPVTPETETPPADALLQNAPDVAAVDDCLAYRDFVARNAEEETAAQDLNASMLADLQTGGAEACN